MGRLTVQNLDDSVIDALNARAARHGRTLEAELRLIVERAVAEPVIDIAEARERAERISRSLEGRTHSDSAAMIREDRDR